MTYNTIVADRVSEALVGAGTVEERHMFGALGFMINGKLAVCVGQNDVMYKLGPELTRQALADQDAQPVTMSDRTMKAWVVVDNSQIEKSETFDKWLRAALDYNISNSQTK